MVKIRCGKCIQITEAEEIVDMVYYKCKICDTINEVDNIMLHEWLNFKYSKFLKSIEAFIKKDDFEKLKATNEFEKMTGKLSENQIGKLKSVLINAFKNGDSIRDIKTSIKSEVGVRDLLKIKDGKLSLDEQGNPIIQTLANQRIGMIARTETTRAAAEGALSNYKENDIQEVQFLAAMSQRTCPVCEDYNGQIFTVEEARGMIPYRTHVYCRCTFVAVVK